jgi:nodulation protein E
LLACLSALQGHLPPTTGCQSPDPDCAVDLVHGTARPARVMAAMSNAFAFGGMNASVIVTAA